MLLLSVFADDLGSYMSQQIIFQMTSSKTSGSPNNTFWMSRD